MIGVSPSKKALSGVTVMSPVPGVSWRRKLGGVDDLELDRRLRALAVAVRDPGLAAHGALGHRGHEAVGGDLVGLDADRAARAREADLRDQAEALAAERDLAARDRAVLRRALLEAREALELGRGGKRGARAAAVCGVGDAAARARERDGECHRSCGVSARVRLPGPRQGSRTASLSRACGVSCRARAERVALRTGIRPIRPRASSGLVALRFPRSPVARPPRDSAGPLARRKYIRGFGRQVNIITVATNAFRRLAPASLPRARVPAASH